MRKSGGFQPDKARRGFLPAGLANVGNFLRDGSGSGFGPDLGGSPFHPLNLSPALWLKGDAGITLDAGNVSSWADQSGNGRDFTQSDGGKRPTTDAGLDGVTATVWIAGQILTNAGFAQTDAWTVYAVAEVGGGGTQILGGRDTTSTVGPGVLTSGVAVGGAANVPGVYFNDGAGVFAGGAGAVTGWQLLRVRTTMNVTCEVATGSGAFNSTAIVGQTSKSSWNAISLDSVFSFLGKLTEYFIIPTAVSNGNDSNMIAYFRQRYPTLGI